MKNLKEQLNLFLIAIIICYFIINFKKDSINIYNLMALSIPGYFVIFLNFNFKKNYKLTLKLFTTSLAILSYGYYFYFIDFYSNKISPFKFIISNSFLFLSIHMGTILLKYKINTSNDLEEKEPLIPKRKEDLKRIVTYLDKFESVGINAKWGDGKSFILEKLKKLDEINQEYEIIEIDVLSCNIDELQNIIINELENVLHKNGIISSYSHRLKDLLMLTPWLSKIRNLFFKNYSSYGETIQGFKDELRNIDKKILIIYEDIDRINNPENIKKVFAISEKLTSEKIKFIYQYEYINLKNIGFDHVYLEKYIRYKVNLTSLNFFEIIDFIFEHNKFVNIAIDNFRFLDENMQQNNFQNFNDSFNLEKNLYFSFNPISIRKIQTFLKELDNLILTSKEFLENKEVVIKAVFLKHFLTEKYEEIDIAKNLYDTFNFKIKDRSYTLQELYDDFKEVSISSELLKISLADEANKNNLCILSFLGFNLILNNLKFDDNNQRIKKIYEEPLTKLKSKNGNEKINRIVWKVIANGKSEYTDYEINALDLIDNVLSKSENDIEEAFEEFRNRWYCLKSFEDNRTVARMGITIFIELAKALQLIEIDEQLKIKFLKLYIKYEKISSINIELIQILNYFNIGSNNFYLRKLEIINDLKINGNLNDEDCFKKFLRDNISIMTIKILSDTGIYHFHENIQHLDISVTILKQYIYKIEKLKEKISKNLSSTLIENDINITIEFAKKILALISYKHKVFSQDRSINIKFSGNNTISKEIEKLKNTKNNNPNNFSFEVEESYKKDSLNFIDIERLL